MRAMETFVVLAAIAVSVACGDESGPAPTSNCVAAAAPPEASVHAVATWLSVWRERDPAARLAIVETAFSADGVLMDALLPNGGIFHAYQEIADAVGPLAGLGWAGTGLEIHHARGRGTWELVPVGAASPLLVGFDYYAFAPDNRLQRVIAFTTVAAGGPVAPSSADEPMQAFRNALNTADAAARDAALEIAFEANAVFFEATCGELDRTGLSNAVGAYLAANPRAKVNFDEIFEDNFVFRIDWSITGAAQPVSGQFLGTRTAPGGLITEVTEFEGAIGAFPD